MRLDDIRSLKDPLLSYKYQVDFPNEIKLDANRVSGVTLPFASSPSEAMFYYGQNVYNADIKQMSPLTIQFVEDQYGSITKGLQQWRDLVVDKKGNYGYPDEYKKEITVSILTNNDQASLVFRLIGCWPSTPSPLNFSAESSNAVTISQEFSCDDIEYLSKIGGADILTDTGITWNGPRIGGITLPKSVDTIGAATSIPTILKKAGEFVTGLPKVVVTDKGIGVKLPKVNLPKVPNINIPGVGGVSQTINKEIGKIGNKINTKVNKVEKKVTKKLPKIKF